MLNLMSINKMWSQTPCDPIVTYTQDDMATHYFDRTMVNVTVGLSQDQIQIGNIRLSTTKRDMQKLQIKGTTW